MRDKHYSNHIYSTPDGVDIFVEVHGKRGRPIVFIPGLGDNHLSWKAQVRELSNDYRIIVIDNRGAGNSSVPLEPYSIAQMADDAHGAVKMLDLPPVIAVGVSMGGAICQQWAARNPSDIERLVLSSTWGRPDVFISTLFKHWKCLAERGDRRALIESILLFCYSPSYLHRFPETVRSFVDGETLNLIGFVFAAQACCDHDFLGTDKLIEHPTLMIIGEEDILIRPELSYSLLKAIQNTRVEKMPTGHMTYWEEPTAFNELLTSFIAV